MAINLKWQERSYGGKKFRPQTQIHKEAESQLLIVVTTWGQTQIADKVIESVKNFISMASDDEDMTMAYERKENLHKMGNILRMAIITTSEKIYSQYNREEYNCGFEIFAAVQDGPQWIYVSCGQPCLIISRKNIGMIPLSQAIDMNILTQKQSLLDPLPSQLLGIGQNPPLQYGNIRLQEGDKVALISRTYLPQSFYCLDFEDFTTEKISLTLAEESPDTPFWIGLANIYQF